MEFKYLSASEFEGLSEYQAEKYLDEKRLHEIKMSEENAKAAAQEAIKGLVPTEEERKAEIDAAVTAAVQVKTDEYDKKLEKALSDQSRAKDFQGAGRKKALSDQIGEFLSTEAGEKMLKEYPKNKAGLNFEIKAPGTMTVPAGSTREEWAPNVVLAHEAVHARNIIPVSPTSATAIKYNQFSLGADGNLINSVAAGDEKPQFEYIVTPKTAPVVKIAGWLQLHDEFLDDIEGARDFLASELPQAYMDAEDAKMLREGLGGDDIDSLWNQAQQLALPKGSVTTSSNKWDKLAASLTQVRRNKRVANAIWTSPEYYLDLLINKDDQNAYTYPIVMDANGILRIAGVPIFQHGVFGEDEFLTGDYVRGARIFQKQAINIRYSREHNVNFTHNETTVLIEARVALADYFPDGFVKGV